MGNLLRDPCKNCKRKWTDLKTNCVLNKNVTRCCRRMWRLPSRTFKTSKEFKGATRMSWFTKKKSSKPFLTNWTRLLLKCLATKKPSSIQLPSYTPFPDSYILFSLYPKKFTSRLFSRHNCFNPSLPKLHIFNIPYFVVLLFS